MFNQCLVSGNTACQSFFTLLKKAALQGNKSNRVKQLQFIWDLMQGRLPLEVEDFEVGTIFSSSSLSRMCVQCTSARISRGSTGFTICCSLRFPASRPRTWQIICRQGRKEGHGGKGQESRRERTHHRKGNKERKK